MEFGEYVLFRDNSPASLANKARSPWSSGVWLGRADATDENIIGTASGVKLIRTIRRRPVGEPVQCRGRTVNAGHAMAIDNRTW